MQKEEEQSAFPPSGLVVRILFFPILKHEALGSAPFLCFVGEFTQFC